jgi:hydroxypyruvate reductase/glycerate 2-kinase
MIIKNRQELATSKLRENALDIIEAGIERVLPSTIVQASVSFDPVTKTLYINEYTCRVNGRIFVIGGGKASGLMAQTLEEIVGPENIEAGIVIDKAAPAEFRTQKIKVMQAGHPLPDERGIKAVRAMLDLKAKYSICKDDLVICLISGGGSALMPYPADGLSLGDKQKITGLLLSCGANIHEINTFRKHLSGIKGGRLAQYFSPASVLSLILSDVVGNDMSIIASGLTYPDSSTYADARLVLGKYDLLHKVPGNILSVLEQGCRGKMEETPKSLENVQNYIIGDNRLALEAMAEKASCSGFKPFIVTAEQTGDTAVAARQRAQEILDVLYKPYDAIIMSGETTPVLPDNHGTGGRNQHYAALTMLLLENYPGEWLLASVATDGSDYLPYVAGAIVDRSSLTNLKKKTVDIKAHLERYDSYTLLRETGNSIILTGSTGTNVGDVMLYLLPSSVKT